MNSHTNRLIRALQYDTARLLAYVGEERLAIAVDHCTQHSLCSNRTLCPRCAYDRALKRRRAIEQTVTRLVYDPRLVYGLKAVPSVFADKHWRKLLASPSTFLERADQLRAFRPVRSSGRLKTALTSNLQPKLHTVRPTVTDDSVESTFQNV